MIPKKPNLTIPHPTEECAGKENREISNFVEDNRKFIRLEEDIVAVRQRTERLRLDSETELAALIEKDAKFERWMRDSERRWAELTAANIEIRRIVRAKESRASCVISLPLVSLRAIEDEKRRQLAQLQEELAQKELVQEGRVHKGIMEVAFLQEELLQKGLLQEGHLSELSSVKSCGLLNYLKWTSNRRRRRRQLEMLTASRGDAKMEIATVVKVGCGGRWKWQWPKVGRRDGYGVQRQQCCFIVPHCL